MRALSVSEMDLVAGGNEVEAIVVTAGRNMWGNSSAWGEQRLVLGSQQNGQVVVREFVQNDFSWLSDVMVSVLADDITNLAQAEQRLATQFDPSQIKQQEVAWNAEGKIIDAWTMNDGSIYFDRDRNGFVDQHMKTASNGSVWVDNGLGWSQASPARR